MFPDTPIQEIDSLLQQAWNAFPIFRQVSIRERARFLRTIAANIEASQQLIPVAMEETNLPEARLRVEKARTIFQLSSYADHCEQGAWLEARIDTANPQLNPPKPDIRKYLIPLGPVVVFGASNFPFAYSTAGGDTATALAAGCPVIVKAHPAHALTSELVAQLIAGAVQECGLPAGVFAHVHGQSNETGKTLVMHPRTKAVGFTGSFAGGKALFNWANQRTEPIPVFAEMGSVNPVFLLPEKLRQSAGEIARQYAASITQSVGQFCTNPGLLIGLEDRALDEFLETLGAAIRKTAPEPMLHPGIAKAFREKRTAALSQPDVQLIAESSQSATELQGIPTIASTTGEAFLQNPLLHQEVFGPYSILVRCKDITEMLRVARQLEGQLTSTLMATEEEVKQVPELVDALVNACGRFIFNGVPTGVTVALSMQHGGPYPATTDARFTSVGADGIRRFARPLAYQNWPDSLLPPALQNANPLGIWRTVNNELTKAFIVF
ncbi:MAG: aldehyde dehydrogenase (NADP(+)) [Candidatus Pseudobacter hemicellulosilyticus]|uniref:Aldehyde dehydrogenase (NADP(+)) n=1 Tax=Candidatus Pseudobacter hemicellulosilyticus TaxID=3121375 RepID=A0AAJ5WPR1_9BACT|nr:MAG: aldehyde dehydrogenase (NADP(+)) [Pseudobacter sp.]